MTNKYIVTSILFHVGVFLLFTVKAFFFPSNIPIYEPALKVDLVGLPDKRDPEEKIAPIIKPEEKIPETKIEKKSEAKVDTTKNQKLALNKLKALSAIDKIKNMKKEEETSEAKPEPTSKPIKGNILSAGTALRGLNKIEFDHYIGALDSHVKNNWALPEWMLTQNLKAEILIKIDSSGMIQEKTFVKKSGNSDFDSRVLSAIDRSNPFPPPPEKFIDLVGVRGITFAFPE